MKKEVAKAISKWIGKRVIVVTDDKGTFYGKFLGTAENNLLNFVYVEPIGIEDTNKAFVPVAWIRNPKTWAPII
ncbi:hypothetical protein EQG49_11090 [Periweissella cryptocerci]|uniref:Uncharacterized protein n=1 Tax=Periweissella cryptocerci TaxID=2506420 RepID=A0A4P6YVZ3_9LACO|nr:hypothetical protein [Periweissella cryptocerci]QBO36951.1 hypothetical protein EQG49_11090 [Periweissella cryptocerci]